MRNLEHYDEDSFDFHQEVIASKRNSAADPNYKDRVTTYNHIISNLFQQYDDSFGIDNLVSLTDYDFGEDEASDLKRLYSYRSEIFQKLKLLLTTTGRGRILNTCQNCTISEINSFDHYVPKEEFPEYSVHPKNLFPSCTKCNSYKGQNWRENGDTKFLNLYVDILPIEQYLFVDINVNGDVISTTFYLSNVNGIDPDLYSRIESHYNELKLFQRYSENSDAVITPIINMISGSIDRMSIEDIVEIIEDTSERNKVSYGYNYWKSVLELELISNDDFIQLAVNS